MSSPEVYESMRLQLDALWGHGPGTGTATCYTPVSEVPETDDGQVTLAVRKEFCEYAAVAALLPQLLASGQVRELTAAEYRSEQPPPE